MHTREQFLIKFHLIENELREHLEFLKLKDDKEKIKLIVKYIKEVKEMQSIILNDINESS